MNGEPSGAGVMKWALYGQYRYHGAAWNVGTGRLWNMYDKNPSFGYWPGWPAPKGEEPPQAEAGFAVSASVNKAAAVKINFFMSLLGGSFLECVALLPASAHRKDRAEQCPMPTCDARNSGRKLGSWPDPTAE